ncbi:DUF4296 domain-containing protein [Rufibacter tibetensis]|uniref:DUF4296 domain-containing protein n=1 Tax=Rufibacter tibetensis TaxID=512763 RepID=UPI0012FBA6E5|nr:DUF4296 domain-containing protein [Rufibacter tibetensis]
MKKRLCLLLLPLALFSCTPEEEKPADLISEEKMTRIMIDVQLTEAVIGRSFPNYDSSRVAYKQAHKLILKRHAVSDSAFKHSYDFYLSKPEQLDKIYEVVLDSLSVREAKLTAKSLATAADSSKTQPTSPDTAQAVATKFRRLTLPDSLKALQKRGKRMIK